MRDNQWLAEKLQDLHTRFFPDVQITNKILVRFGRESRTRFGSIISRSVKGHNQAVTFITINSLFKDEAVPEYVIEGTLLHEFTHYSHGFHSPLKQKYKYPHKGGVVNREIRQRGAAEILRQQNQWIKNEYRAFLRSKQLL